MPVTILPCGPVSASGPLASVVGSGSQWADGSDATYGQFGTFSVGSTPNETLSAPLTGTPFSGTVVSAELFIRCDNTDPSGSLLRASVAGLGWVPPEVKSEGAFGGTFSISPGISERLQPMSVLVGTTDLTAVFAQPAALFITWAAAASGSRIRVLEAHIRVTTDAVPYRRIGQRGDGLAGGARRIGRVKTIQGSNRRGAGSIV